MGSAAIPGFAATTPVSKAVAFARAPLGAESSDQICRFRRFAAEGPGIQTVQGQRSRVALGSTVRSAHVIVLSFNPLHRRSVVMGMLLSIAAVILVIAGIITLLSGSVITGIVLIVIGYIVGPGGYSISRR